MHSYSTNCHRTGCNFSMSALFLIKCTLATSGEPLVLMNTLQSLVHVLDILPSFLSVAVDVTICLS